MLGCIFYQNFCVFNFFFFKIINRFNFWYFFSGNLNVTLSNWLIITCITLFIIKFNNKFFFFIFFFLSARYLVKNSNLLIPWELIVGFNSWHPPLFYASLLLTILSAVSCEKFVHVRSTLIISTLIITLLLGGYWGLGNSVWGYFWVNDSIELLLLVYIIILLTRVHTIPSKVSFLMFIFLLFGGFVFLIFMRYGLLFTRHSFFELKKINNLYFIIFLSLTYLIPQSSFLLLIVLFIFSSDLFFIFFISLFIVNYSLVSSMSGVLYFTHFSILCLVTTWLKSKTLNIIFFLGRFVSSASKLLILNNSLSDLPFFVSKFNTTKIILTTKTLNLYSSKLVLKYMFIFSTYTNTAWLVLILTLFTLYFL